MQQFFEIRKNQYQKIRRETQALALSKLLLFSERPLSQPHLIRRQLIRKRKHQKKSLSYKNQQFFLEIRKNSSEKNRRDNNNWLEASF